MKKSLEKRINEYKGKLHDEFKDVEHKCSIDATFNYEFARQHKFNKGTQGYDPVFSTYEAVRKHYARMIKARR